MQKNLSDLPEQAGRIYDAIRQQLASEKSLRIAVSRGGFDEAIARLKRGQFRKPFFRSSKEWLRNIVIDDRAAFEFLAGHIEIEGVFRGRLYRWTGYGTKIAPNENSPPQLQEFIQKSLGPFYLTIQIGEPMTEASSAFSVFCGLLEDVEKSGVR